VTAPNFMTRFSMTTGIILRQGYSLTGKPSKTQLHKIVTNP
jgi:hypothetical protein